MTLKKMNAFMNAVVALHPSVSQSSQHVLPRVLLKRLTSKTIKKYSSEHERSQWSDSMSVKSDVSPSSKKPFTKSTSSSLHESKEKVESPGTMNEIDSNSDSQSSNSSISDPPVTVSDVGSQKKRNEILDKLTEEVSESDETASSCNSDDLPDLNDLSWGKEVKKKVKSHKRKNKDAPKRITKLMKDARKVFEHQAFRYKSSKEFMKSSKVTKEVDSEVQPWHRDNTDYIRVLPKLMSQSPSKQNAASPFEAATAPTVGKAVSKESVMEGSTTSAAELLSLKLKESMEKYVGQVKDDSLSDDSMDVEVQLLDIYVTKDKKQFKERKSNQSQESVVSLDDSDESDSTVVFDDLHIQDNCDLESFQPQSEESIGTVDNGSGLTTATENSNKLKRKNSPLGSEGSVDRYKKQKSDETTPTKKDANQHPMVLIPTPTLVCTVPQAHMPLQSHSSPIVSETASSKINTTAQMQTTDSTQTSVKETSTQTSVKETSTQTSVKETSQLHSDLPSKVSAVDVKGSSVSTVDTVLREEFIDIDSSTSHESDDIPVTTLVTQEVISQAKATSSNSVKKNLDNIGTESQEQIAGSSKSVENLLKEDESPEINAINLKELAVGSNEKPFKSLKLLSLQFHELTTKRTLCEEKIRELKEEYNRKLETLEDQKNKIDAEMNKMIIAMSEWKELSEEEQLVPDVQQAPAAADSAVSVAESTEVAAVPPTSSALMLNSQSIPVTEAQAQSSENMNVVVYNSEKMAINVIPAASIKNFGTKQDALTPKAATLSSHNPRLQADLQKKQTLRLVQKVPATASSSPTSSGDLPATYTLQPRSDSAFDMRAPPNAVVVQLGSDSAFDKRPPPNVVVVPGQQRPLSNHTVCRAAPRPTTRAVQRRVPVGNLLRPAQPKNPGLLHAGRNTSHTQQMQNLTSHVQQKHHCMSVQLQQHQQQKQLQEQQQQLQQQERQQNQQLQQLHLSYNRQQEKQQQQLQQQQQQLVQLHSSGNTHHVQENQKSQPHMQRYQPVQGQPLKNIAPVQGAAVPGSYSSPMGNSNINWTNAQIVPSFPLGGTLIASENNTASPSSRIIATPTQPGNSQITNTSTNTKKTNYIVSAPAVSSVNPANQFQQQLHSLQSGTSSRVTGLSLPHASHSSTADNTDMPLSMETTLAASVNRHTSQSTEFPLPTPTQHKVGVDVQESGIHEHICKMCGSPGIFTCCNDVIYCSMVCQASDWTSHKQQCTNTSTPETS